MPPLTAETYRIENAKPGLDVRVELKPAKNMIISLLLLSEAQDKSGFGGWIEQTLQTMTPEERRNNYVVTNGLSSALLQTEGDWASVPEFIASLERMDAQELRSSMVRAFVEHKKKYIGEHLTEAYFSEQVLGSLENYLSFLRETYHDMPLDEALETETYSYLSAPERMKALIVNHLDHMWTRYLRSEWERVQPMLEDSVRAFRQVDFSRMGIVETLEFVTGRDLEREVWEERTSGTTHLTFIPNAHIGPYIIMSPGSNGLLIFFGARLPSGTSIQAPDLSRNEIQNRLNALGDDTRLQILRLIAEEGEQKSQDIITRLGLSQSMASRHLSQLTATGFLMERRCDGSKCYKLNMKRLEDTLQALVNYLTPAKTG